MTIPTTKCLHCFAPIGPEQETCFTCGNTYITEAALRAAVEAAMLPEDRVPEPVRLRLVK